MIIDHLQIKRKKTVAYGFPFTAELFGFFKQIYYFKLNFNWKTILNNWIKLRFIQLRFVNLEKAFFEFSDPHFWKTFLDCQLSVSLLNHSCHYTFIWKQNIKVLRCTVSSARRWRFLSKVCFTALHFLRQTWLWWQ